MDNPIRREVIIGDCRLILGDCLEVMPTLGTVDAVVTDPPYGIGYTPQLLKGYDGNNNNWKPIIGDGGCLDFAHIFLMKAFKIIWGAENFYHQLPHRGRWICWHKRSPATAPNSMRGSDFELAWMDKADGFYKYINVIHGGVINADSIKGNNEKRFHPTQKPIAVMEFCIMQKEGLETILDPFMGSGTTGVACVKLGRKFIGIEIDEGYFDIACKRVEEAYRQPDFFVERPAPAEQLDMPEGSDAP